MLARAWQHDSFATPRAANASTKTDPMGTPFLVSFPGPDEAPRHVVGGKGLSLIRLAAAGFSVPPGAVLTTAFFAPWFEAIAASTAWTRLMEAAPNDWPLLCDTLKERAQTLSWTAAQRDAMDRLRRDLAPANAGAGFAVRSSSPEEDLASASFAGSYETRLGVKLDQLDEAVRACFASSLDARVLTYKQEHGLDVSSPQIAVVVQRQINSEVAGVGFSLNPVTNDYDEAVIDANWGLGTSVVEGRSSPDHFVVDKVKRQVVEVTPGDKQVAVWLDAEEGTVERASDRPAKRTLTDAQLRALTGVICRIEALYEKPVDIEWAYAGGDLYVLQARPITTYVPLPPEMVTEPGAPRRLYADAALSKGLTTNRPISPLGLDFMNSLFSSILESWVGPLRRDRPPGEALFFFAGGRMYVNYSNMLWLASPEMLAQSAAPTDTLSAEILKNIDAERYRAPTKPAWAGARSLGLIPQILWNLRGFFSNLLRTLLFPARAHRAFRETTEALESELRDQLDGGLSLSAFRRTYTARLATEVFDVIMPAVLAGALPPDLAVLGKDDETQALADKLTRGASGNVVVEMGMALHRLASLLDPSAFDDIDRLAERIEQRELPQAFLDAWDDFLSNFGWRGPHETDLASPRYADDPRLALRPMSYMAAGGADFDPETAHERLVKERAEAYAELMRRLSPPRRALLRWIYRRIDRFAGTRDTPKHLLVLLGYAVRKRALAIGRTLAKDNRLDAAEDVFNLTFDDLEAAAANPSLDLRAISEERTRFRKKLEAHVRTFPPVIDSRGRILRPPPAASAGTPGLLSGMPVSPGTATGPAKVLHAPDEKPVDPGDVLVAYTTDPGWTPLFVNAAAIVLEVGGALQHGAVVAREYGKPCVVGISGIVDTLRDGEHVEVDGGAGTVRRRS